MDKSSDQSTSDKPTQPESPSSTVPDEAKAKPELPPLTDHEFKAFNRMAVKMNYFHEHFRRTWNMLHGAASANKRPHGMSLRQYIEEGLQFTQQLTAHHNIEETYFFPMMARRMPEFRGGRAELLSQHKEIHRGMDGLEEYLHKCQSRELDFEMSVMKEKLDSWGEVLWKHLDQEVETLGAENMRRYWTIEEIRSMPI
ncbi:hypothetical protein F5X68DRAFT_237309 [Plectosphaerella plurivora]|uniref:Hemerythrin-like domain-containing protein n=1 Tax=Plectosphaerella plurivora TaxID=936078 RepID=A0A9P9A539_9PEZI|nr:hypothetical protein F5X68DRAFT_237309 [Plectosphaerella plurivora]